MAAPSLGVMRATTFIAAVALAFTILVTPPYAEAQPAGKVARIGFLSVSSASAGPTIEAFRRGLSDLGYVEGRSVIVEYYWAEGQ